MKPAPLILASASPRRREMLASLRLTFEVVPAGIDESIAPSETPEAHVVRLAREKADSVGGSRPDAVVLAADTIVVIDGNILGKPASKAEGMRMLALLSGRSHSVLSGVSIRSPGGTESFYVETRVWFRPVSEPEAEQYWQTGEPADKAGGYALQGVGGAFVTSLAGSHSNVIGLPLAETVTVLRRHGIECLGESDSGTENIQELQDGQYG